jgi:hypothetical protein
MFWENNSPRFDKLYWLRQQLSILFGLFKPGAEVVTILRNVKKFLPNNTA